MSWQIQANRSLAEMHYFCDYRYAPGTRRTLLDFECDILSPLIEKEECGGPEVHIGGDWLRRNITGHWQQTDGQYVHTNPNPERTALLLTHLKNNGYHVSSILDDHQGDLDAAITIRDEKSYRFADLTVLAGTFRGAFIGKNETNQGIVELALFIFFVPGEDLFRVRIFETFYSRKEQISECRLKQQFETMQFDTWRVTDRFASFGTNRGCIFGGPVYASEYFADSFNFVSKGRRVSALTLTSANDNKGSIRLDLCRKPDQINRMLNIARAIDNTKAHPIAAE